MSNVKDAWYSETAAKRYGYSIYKTPDGREVKITEVMQSGNMKKLSKWSDIRYVGRVTDWIRRVEGSEEMYTFDFKW